MDGDPDVGLLEDGTQHRRHPTAIEECDQLGRDAFLERYGYREARDYFIVHNGRRYDSKAIAGVARDLLKEYGIGVTTTIRQVEDVVIDTDFLRGM